MTFADIHDDLKDRISPRRFAHIEGVIEAAGALAFYYGADVEQAEMAALLHDSAKELPLARMQKLVDRCGPLVDREVYQNGALLHGPAGAVIAAERYGIEDQAILEAVRVHTTGKAGMSTLDKIIFLADYIDKTRKFSGVDELRRLAFIDLDQAVLAGYDSTIGLLLKKKLTIYFKTIIGRNDIIFRINNRSGRHKDMDTGK